jgi:hypothetical protein
MRLVQVWVLVIAATIMMAGSVGWLLELIRGGPGMPRPVQLTMALMVFAGGLCALALASRLDDDA